MKIKELEAKFAELDRLWLSSPHDLQVRLDESGKSIVVTRQEYDYLIDPSITSFGESTGEDCRAYDDTFPAPGIFDPVSISGQMRSPFQSIEPVMAIDISEIEISEEVVYKRMTLLKDPQSKSRLTDVKLMGLGATGIYQVVEDYSYPVDYVSVGREMPLEIREEHQQDREATPHLCTITVKEGFQFDRATVPRIFWIFVSKDDLSNVAPLFHDVLYRFSGVLPRDWVKPYTTFSRREADTLFFHMMERSGVVSWRLHLAYQAVCRFSSFAWGKEH